jgi:chromosome segregation ATPase
MSHENCGCEVAQAGVRHAITEMAASRGRLQAAITELKRVDQEAQMTTDTAQQAAIEQTLAPATTDATLLQAALEEAGRINRMQATMIEELREASQAAAETMYQQRNDLANWQQRYQSAADRLAENWPTDPQVAQMRAWITDLKEALAATQAALAEAERDAKGWKDRFYKTPPSYDPAAPNYAAGPVAPVVPGPAKDTDEEMLG